MRVSHETIYRSLFIQARGVLKEQLIEHLRSRRVMRRSRKSTTSGQDRGRLVDAVSIKERPASVEDRAVPGHWEGDLISGSNNTHVATLVERKSRFTLLVGLKGKDANTVVHALATSTTWTETVSCGFGRAESWGSGSGSSKAVHVQELWGEPADSASVIGRNSSGGVVSSCTATDTTIDLFPVTDSSGCGTAVKHTLQVNYY